MEFSIESTWKHSANLQTSDECLSLTIYTLNGFTHLLFGNVAVVVLIEDGKCGGLTKPIKQNPKKRAERSYRLSRRSEIGIEICQSQVRREYKEQCSLLCIPSTTKWFRGGWTSLRVENSCRASRRAEWRPVSSPPRLNLLSLRAT